MINLLRRYHSFKCVCVDSSRLKIYKTKNYKLQGVISATVAGDFSRSFNDCQADKILVQMWTM